MYSACKTMFLFYPITKRRLEKLGNPFRVLIVDIYSQKEFQSGSTEQKNNNESLFSLSLIIKCSKSYGQTQKLKS
jgi:hypothetical protein